MVAKSTRERLKEAALQLFCDRGFSATTIGAIETAAGLAPRSGAFYRHFESKRALLEELAMEIAESPEEFDFEGLRLYGDTRAELVAIAQAYVRAAKRQAPVARLIEEYRLLEDGREVESGVNERMLEALANWVATKRLARGSTGQQLEALAVTVFGSWLFYLGKVQQGVEVASLPSDTFLDQWASYWARALDSEPLD